MKRFLRTFKGDASGVTNIEYGLLAVLVALALLVTVEALGANLVGGFTQLQALVNAAG